MPRLIYWNVQSFSDDKFFWRSRKRGRDGEELWGENAAQSYLNALVTTITANAPAFIVIVEVRPGGNTGGGTLLSDDGAMRLLRYLRLHNDVHWALVPPVISGLGNAGEGVAVYYRRTATMFFTGPWRWPGGWGPAAPAAGMLGVYPGPFTFAFSKPVNNRTVPGGNNLYNPGQVERRLAGQWRYVAGGGGGGGPAVPPPPPVMFGALNARSPFRTTFYDSALGQNYSIIACHATPSQNGGAAGVAAAPSTLGTEAIGNLHEVQNIGVNERIVVVGDFNVSLFQPLATAVAYAPFTAAAYTRVIDSNPGHALPVGYPSRGYLITHIKQFGATPDDTDGYPAFGYMSKPDFYGQYDSIDNAFVRGGALANATIANTVTGAPYNAVAPPPADVPAGALPYASAMADPAVALNSPHGYDPNGMNYDDEVDYFQDIANYGRALGVSDHLPLVFDF